MNSLTTTGVAETTRVATAGGPMATGTAGGNTVGGLKGEPVTVPDTTGVSGVPGHLNQFALFLQWQLRRQAAALPFFVIMQLLISLSVVVGYGLVMGDIGRLEGLYLATGGPTITLVMVGLVMTPQFVSESRSEGGFDWLMTLPVSRLVFVIVDMLVWSLVALPGLVAGIVFGSIRFDAGLTSTWWFPLAALLIALTATSIGYCVAVILSHHGAVLASQLFIFLFMLFTPVAYPASRLPQWLQTAHEWLPLEPMAQLVRSGLAPADFPVDKRMWLVLGAWCAVSCCVTYAVLQRRK